MKKKIILFMLLSVSYTACDMVTKKDTDTETKKKKKIALETDEQSEEPSTTKKKKPLTENAEDVAEPNSRAEILNNIMVHETGGLQVARAFLSFEDGQLVPKTNKVALNKAVYLNLLIEDGWIVQDGNVSLDASERIITDEGQLVLHAPNLFKAIPSVEETKANHIYLKATITKTRADVSYFLVSYRVWDKQGDGEIKGSYKLYIDEGTE